MVDDTLSRIIFRDDHEGKRPESCPVAEWCPKRKAGPSVMEGGRRPTLFYPH